MTHILINFKQFKKIPEFFNKVLIRNSRKFTSWQDLPVSNLTSEKEVM